jgi:hypothetical protein
MNCAGLKRIPVLQAFVKRLRHLRFQLACRFDFGFGIRISVCNVNRGFRIPGIGNPPARVTPIRQARYKLARSGVPQSQCGTESPEGLQVHEQGDAAFAHEPGELWASPLGVRELGGDGVGLGPGPGESHELQEGLLEMRRQPGIEAQGGDGEDAARGSRGGLMPGRRGVNSGGN